MKQIIHLQNHTNNYFFNVSGIELAKHRIVSSYRKANIQTERKYVLKTRKSPSWKGKSFRKLIYEYYFILVFTTKDILSNRLDTIASSLLFVK